MANARYPKSWTVDAAESQAEQTPISAEEKARRHSIVAQATHSLTLEGLERSEESLRIALLWANGKISLEEKTAMTQASLQELLSDQSHAVE